MKYLIGLMIVMFGFAGAFKEIDFLVPAEKTALVDQNYTILAEGAEVIWYHWQSILLIALFALLTCGTIVFMYFQMQEKTNSRIQVKFDELDDQIRSLKKTEDSFIDAQTKKISSSFANEELILDEKRCENYETEAMLAGTEYKLNEIREKNEAFAKASNRKNQYQAKLNRGAITQKRRFVGQKKLIVQYLESRNWTVGDEQLTFNFLLREAKKYDEAQQ